MVVLGFCRLRLTLWRAWRRPGREDLETLVPMPTNALATDQKGGIGLQTVLSAVNCGFAMTVRELRGLRKSKCDCPLREAGRLDMPV
jgi:hypothetical protein